MCVSVCVCVCVCACMHAKSLQSCLTLCHPMDCSLPDPSVHGILQARILEWVAMPSSRGSSWPRDQTCISYVSCIGSQVLSHQCHPFFLAHRLSCSVACGIFPNRDWSRVSCTGRFFATEPPGKPRILLSLLTWLPFHCQPSPHLLSSLWLAGLIRKWLLVSYLLQFWLLTFQVSPTHSVSGIFLVNLPFWIKFVMHDPCGDEQALLCSLLGKEKKIIKERMMCWHTEYLSQTFH